MEPTPADARVSFNFHGSTYLLTTNSRASLLPNRLLDSRSARDMRYDPALWPCPRIP
jgi:hypothetical protein